MTVAAYGESSLRYGAYTRSWGTPEASTHLAILLGSITSSGAISRSLTRAFIASLTPSGAIAKSTARLFGGSLSVMSSYWRPVAANEYADSVRLGTASRTWGNPSGASVFTRLGVVWRWVCPNVYAKPTMLFGQQYRLYGSPWGVCGHVREPSESIPTPVELLLANPMGVLGGVFSAIGAAVGKRFESIAQAPKGGAFEHKPLEGDRN